MSVYFIIFMVPFSLFMSLHASIFYIHIYILNIILVVSYFLGWFESWESSFLSPETGISRKNSQRLFLTVHPPIQTCFRNRAIVHLKWKLTQLCIFPQAGPLFRVHLSSLTYQAPCTHAHLFIAVFLICSLGVGFGKLPSHIPFILADSSFW